MVSIAHAQDSDRSTDDSENELEQINIVGQRAMLESAINKQRNADYIASIITNDSIGNLPAQNVAEAVRRLAGVNVLDDQGEGRFISVRGLDPELNSASVNGVRLPSPESDSRAVALDVIPSELVESIEVIKTLTPDMDADTIGASIRINTVNSINRDNFVKAQVATGYNDLNSKYSPEFGADFSQKISDKLGIAGGFKYQKRLTSTDNIEMDGWSETDEGVVYAEDLEYRDYDVTRERTGLNLSFDFKMNEQTELYLRTMYSKFDDTELRRRLTFALNDAEPLSSNGDTVFFVSGDDGDDDLTIGVERDIKDRFESQIIKTLEFGGETVLENWTIDYSASFAQASEKEYKTQDPTEFKRDFENDELGVIFDYSQLTYTPYEITSGIDLFFDASSYEFDVLEEVNGRAEDDEQSFQFNATRRFVFEKGDFELKTGAKLRQRDKSFNVELTVLEDFDGDYTLADVLGSQSYGLIDVGPTPSLQSVRQFNRENRSSFETIEVDFVESTLENYSVSEDIFSAYVMGRYETDDWMVVGGFRYEGTENDLRGNLVDVDEETATQQNFSNDYSHLLPSLSAKYSVKDNLVLRGGIFKSVVRPKISALAPRFEINEDLEAVFGNPELEPYEAWNLDLSLEYYFTEAAVVQIGYFSKDIENFIVTTEFDEEDAPYFGEYNGISFSEAEVSINGEDATVNGFEIAYDQAFESGLILGFNYTYTDSEGNIGERLVPLPSSSETTYNAVLGYEKDAFSTRMTLSYRDDYLDELASSAEEDRYVKAATRLDVTASYDLNDSTQIFVKLLNLTDEPYVAYQSGPTRDRLLQYEEYSWSAKFGLKIKL